MRRTTYFGIGAIRLQIVREDSFAGRRFLDLRDDGGRFGSEGGPEIAARGDEKGIVAALDLLANILVPTDCGPAGSLDVESLRAIAAESGPSLSSFLSRLSLCEREGEGASQGEKIALLTFHAAKGLEFSVVFIAGAEEGITPLPDDLEEERRLFYVALTRARENLFITHCARRTVFGRSVDRAPSRFLSAIPRDLVTEERQRETRRNVQLSLFSD